MRCGFGAVRVGALLGRLRLHLQTERFLAVHRGDILWERGCVGAALALAVIAAGMQEAELDAPLSAAVAQNPQGRHKWARPGLQRPIRPSEYAFHEGRAEQVSEVCDEGLGRGAR
jgi:hypothetical protein